MTPSPTRPITAVLVAALALAACNSATRGAVTSPQPTTADEGSRSGVARAKADSVRYPYTEADVRFMSSMIGHHSQALIMAAWAPTHGADGSVRTLAERIINGQQDEIGTMQRWLGDRGKPIPESGRTDMTDSVRSEPALSDAKGQAHHEMPMAGMLTGSQLRELEGAKGSEFDRLFLTFMIQHHQGAVAMVKDLFGSQGAAQDETVFKFANDVSVDQSTEIARMERMLAALTAEGRSP